MRSLEEQREYVATLKKMWMKTARVCGMLSKPERAMLDVLNKEWQGLREMEDDNE